MAQNRKRNKVKYHTCIHLQHTHINKKCCGQYLLHRPPTAPLKSAPYNPQTDHWILLLSPTIYYTDDCRSPPHKELLYVTQNCMYNTTTTAEQIKRQRRAMLSCLKPGHNDHLIKNKPTYGLPLLRSQSYLYYVGTQIGTTC